MEANMQKIGDQFNVTITEETIAEIKRIAKKHNIKQAEAARNLMEMGLETYQLCEKAGVPQFAEIFKRLKTAIMDHFQMRIAY
jgi:rRNA-processing protein FCF1